MSGTTYSKFFWQDWQGDLELRRCSTGARGLWMELLCIAARSSTTGHVLLNGEKPLTADLKDVCALKEDLATIAGWIEELLAKGVCDRTRDGVLISRRLVRDARRRQISASGGKARQKQIAENKEESSVGTRRVAQPPSTINQNPSAISHQPPLNPQGDLAAAVGRIDRITQLTGIDPGVRGPSWIRTIVDMETGGIDFDLDLIPVIAEMAGAGRVPKDLRGLGYFREPALERARARGLAGARGPLPEVSAKDWDDTMLGFVYSGFWPRGMRGPAPTEEGCRCPKEILAKHELNWVRQGCEAQDLSLFRPAERTSGPFWGSNVVPMEPKKAGGSK